MVWYCTGDVHGKEGTGYKGISRCLRSWDGRSCVVRVEGRQRGIGMTRKASFGMLKGHLSMC